MAGALGGSRRLSKRQKFTAIIAILVVLGIVLSVVTKFTVIKEGEEDFLHISVAGPLSGAAETVGRSFRQGAELYVDLLNEAGGVGGRKIKLHVVDDGDDADKAARAAAEAIAPRTVAVVGHWSDATARAGAAVYEAAGVPLVVPASLTPGSTAGQRWVFATVFDQRRQAEFLANYARNVLGLKLLSIIQDRALFGDSMAQPFEDTYMRFGTAIRYNWQFDSTEPGADARLQEIVAELAEKLDAGALFLAVRGREGAKLLRMIRDARIKSVIVAPSSMTTGAFATYMEGEVSGGKDVARYTDGLMVTTPLLFDTANEVAQNFLNRYQRRFGQRPDWVGAYAYDAVQLVVEAIREAQARLGDKAPIADLRAGVRDALAAHNSLETAVVGLGGNRYFDEARQAQTPVLIGIYNGRNMISALTQLQPIRPGGRTNYIEELRRGKVLYVNDRFMYKTNVVYTGLELKEVAELKIDENYAVLDLMIWFRYRGEFEPQDLVFANAVEPVKLETPIEEQKTDDMVYRLYRVKGKFLLNFTQTERFYGSHVVGVSLSHRKLNRNNLLYVVDVLGLGLEAGETMTDKVERAQAINPSSGWVVERAWVSQDVVGKTTLGDPTYVGYTANEPEFSKIDLALLIKKGEVSPRDFVPAEYFVYVGIFGLLGTVCAVWLDRRSRRRFWSMQSWGLRAVSWPLLLVAVGNLLLEVSFKRLDTYYIDMIVMVYDILWWLVPARLAGLALERFVWVPLEDHTERTIPNVVRVFASVVVYSLAGFGIVAFVFGETITSLLATSGLLAMIVGLAIQANISNIFSGIVLNIERPFNVGDWIKIGDLDEGVVVDITWRTTRLKTRNGYVISLPNGQVSESQVHNFNSFEVVRVEMPVFLDAGYDPDACTEIMMRGLEKARHVVGHPPKEVRFKGVAWNYGWITEFELQFWINNYAGREDICEGVLANVWGELRAAGITPIRDPGRLSPAQAEDSSGEALEVGEDHQEGAISALLSGRQNPRPALG